MIYLVYNNHIFIFFSFVLNFVMISIILKIKDYSIMKKENIGNKVKLKIFFSVIEDITKIEEIKVEY